MDPQDTSKSSVKRPPGGVFKAMAAKAGMSQAAFAEANIHADTMVGKLARMYYTAQGNHGDGKSDMADAGDKRTGSTRLYQVG